jgi:hypothetical protein
MTYNPSSATKGITAVETETLAVYAIDIDKNVYLGGAWGTLSFDGVQQVVSGGRGLFFNLEVGSTHVLELVGIADETLAFDHWITFGDSWKAPVIDNPYSKRINVTIVSGGPNGLACVLKHITVPTSITINAPDKVAVGANFTTSGVLRRSDTNVGLAGQTVNIYYNGTKITSVTTGSDGSYSADCSIPTAGIYTLKAEFPGSSTYAASVKEKSITAGEVAPPIPLWKVGLALFAIIGCGVGGYYVSRRRKM